MIIGELKTTQLRCAVILLGYIFIISKVTHGDDFNMIVGELTLTQTGGAI